MHERKFQIGDKVRFNSLAKRRSSGVSKIYQIENKYGFQFVVTELLVSGLTALFIKWKYHQ